MHIQIYTFAGRVAVTHADPDSIQAHTHKYPYMHIYKYTHIYKYMHLHS